MCERFPALELVRFCNSGSEATLMCVSLARATTRRQSILAFHGAYHGAFLGFAGGGSPLNAPFPFLLAPYNDADAARRLIAEHAGDLAAIIVEPLMGGAGCIPGDPEFLRTLADEADRHGIVLVFDEVMTSRLAPGGLHGKLGLRPGLVAFGKYLGGGVGFGAFGGRRDLMQRLDPTRSDALMHSGTYNNNVLSMAAGIAGLERVYTPDAAEALNGGGDRLRERLNALARARGVPVQVLGQGSMLCIHPQRAPIRRPADLAMLKPELRKLVHLEMNLRGIYMARRGFMSLSLPLTAADHDALVAAFDAVLGDYADVLARDD
jgi:glutamate-1-semialdehyde 2,1-aminomutase